MGSRAAFMPAAVQRPYRRAACALQRTSTIMATANPVTSIIGTREDVDARPIAHRIAWLAMSAAIVLSLSSGFGALVFFTLR